ncbi:transporter substrate-binding domain-containing protein [Thalassomonas viridans]|uniref:Transporter substrate-binding domain-containing protein n=1 Tax=Thalassomonas viridans TaxID=137584 RepID=A0AAE9Z7J2_9GAMM|nr:transporter substrate-binding domain-containing protein [Thalassomonas viridans]WDE07968.1 transporter substrate-binding domain-containing protein [Thalassomonas viridans]
MISKHENVLTIQGCEDILLPAYRALRFTPAVVELPGRRALFAANSGKTDAELCRIDHISRQYPNLIKVEPALVEFSIVALSTRPLPDIKTRADLTGYTLGSQRGMKAAENYFQGDNIRYENNIRQVIKLLDDGLIDYAIVSLSGIRQMLQAQLRDDLVIHHPPLFHHKLYHYIHKRHQHLAAALAFEISRIKYQQAQQE